MGPSLPSFFDLLLLSSTTQIYNIQYNNNFIISLSLSHKILYTPTHTRTLLVQLLFFFFFVLAFLHSQPVKPELLTTMILILIYIFFSEEGALFFL